MLLIHLGNKRKQVISAYKCAVTDFTSLRLETKLGLPPQSIDKFSEKDL